MVQNNSQNSTVIPISELNDSLSRETISPINDTLNESIDSSLKLTFSSSQSDSLLISNPSLQDTIESVPRNFQAERGVPITSFNSDWMVGVLLFALVLMAIVRFSFSKYLFKVFDSILNYQTASNLLSEKNMRNLRGSIFLNFLFFVNLALFLVQYAVYILSLNQENNNFIFFLYSFLLLVVVYSGKAIIIRLMGYIFGAIKEAKEYLHTVFIYNKNLGLFLLPITISVPFIAPYATPMLLNFGLFITLIFYTFRLFRGFKILFRQHVSIFYMILYLCALEILPLLMIYKLLYLLV